MSKIIKNKITIVHAVVFSEIIMRYFEDIKNGFASDFAWYELLGDSEAYLKKSNKDFEEYINLVFNIQKKDLEKIKKIYNKQIKELEKMEII